MHQIQMNLLAVTYSSLVTAPCYLPIMTVGPYVVADNNLIYQCSPNSDSVICFTISNM